MSEFKFKYFTIQQAQAAMKVGTDAMIFGAVIAVNGKSNALDIGTGTGILSLMLAQRNSQLKLTAIEIEPLAAEEAAHNFTSSPFPNDFSLIHNDFLEEENLPQFDLIVTNPPFFQDDLKGISAQRNLARHTDSLPFQDLIKKVRTLLSEDGHFWVILPVEEMHVFTDLAQSHGLLPSYVLTIYGKPGVESRKVCAFQKRVNHDCVHETLLVRNENNAYTDAYKLLTKEYHGVAL